MQKIELLAPAKDFVHGKTAINYGADAVYVGAPNFSARANAGCSMLEIQQLVQYAHLYHAKVFVALNTLLYDNELEQARNIIIQCYNAGVDAMIIQDFGLLEMDLPPISLHASTQTNNYNLDRIKFIDQLGFDRIILARELSLPQIKEIKIHTKSELECFVHGALCVSFSGQCYMSYMACNRSANRGECAQLCRVKYSLFDKNSKPILKDKHLLSLKDLNLSPNIEQMIDAGITSFKIEGRLKDINYIKNTVAYYRKAIDAVLEQKPAIQKSSHGTTAFCFTPAPEKSFNRGFTPYFIKPHEQKQANFESPKSIGEYIGTARQISPDTILMTNNPLHNGDGICFLNGNQEFTGARVNIVNNDKVTLNDAVKISPDTKIYRNHDHEFSKILDNDKSRRKIAVSITIKEALQGFELTATDLFGFSHTALFNVDKQPANDPERLKQTIVQQLSKSGDTIFEVNEIVGAGEIPFFIPIPFINQSRREILEQLAQLRLSQYQSVIFNGIHKNVVYPIQEIGYQENVTNHLAEKFYIHHGVTKIEKGVEWQQKPENIRLMTTKYCIKREINSCPKYSKPFVKLDEPLYLSDAINKYQLAFDCEQCQMIIMSTKK